MPSKQARKTTPETPDRICARFAADGGSAITVRLLEPDEQGEVPLVLFQGSRKALAFIGRLFLAQSQFSDSGFQLEPKGAGRRLFTRRSTVGLYIYRTKNSRQRQKPK